MTPDTIQMFEFFLENKDGLARLAPEVDKFQDLLLLEPRADSETKWLAREDENMQRRAPYYINA